MEPIIPAVLAVAVAAVAAVTDHRTGHIPNWLTLPALFAGLFLGGMIGAAEGLLRSFFGALLCGAVPWLLWRRGALGGGDVKLLAALGALLGVFAGLEAELYGFLAGAVLSMGKLAWEGKLLGTLRNAGRTTLNVLLPSRHRKELRPELMTEYRMGGAIFIGTAFAVWNLHPFGG
jgi:prepilin peptidase CpaA